MKLAAIMFVLLLIPIVYSQNSSNSTLDPVTGQSVREPSPEKIFLGILTTIAILFAGMLYFIYYVRSIRK